MAFQILLEGQDITLQSDQMSIDAVDALGQGSGAGASPLPQGRAGTLQFDTSLGPINTAVGGGTTIVPTAFQTDTFLGRTSSSGFGNATDMQIWTGSTNMSSDGSVSGNKGQVTASSGFPVFLYTALGSGRVADSEVLVRVTLGDTSNNIYCLFRNLLLNDGSNTYKIVFGGSQLILRKAVAGVTTDLSTVSVTTTGSNTYWLRARVQGSVLSAKYWLDGTTEPTNWTTTATDSTYTTAGYTQLQFAVRVTSTIQIDNYSATNLTPPVLVRMGEVIVKDVTGTTIWGGFSTKYTDISTAILGNTKQNFTTINAVDYEGQLSRIIVNESYVAMTDVQIINAVLAKYAPWVNRSLLPVKGFFVFPAKLFRNVSVLQVIQTVAGVTGYLIWVDFAKAIHYASPASTSTATFSLSDSPDFVRSFPHNVQEFLIDDNSAINRVTFYGGKKLSGDFTQDVSPLANSNNVVFPTAYYPHVTSDGKFHVTVNGAEKVVGYATGATSAANTFKSAGGLADCLINPDAHNVTFDVAPSSGSTVLIKFQYEFPLTVVVTDETSHKFFGDPYLDGSISDQNVFDAATGVQRAKVLLSQQSFGLTSLKVDCWQPGIKSGQLLSVKNTLRGINGTYLVQQVETQPLGAGNFVYHVTLGAWHWNIIDVIVKLAASTAFTDNSQDENTSILALFQVAENITASVSTIKKSETIGPYYARSTAVGDGKDAFPGFSTITPNYVESVMVDKPLHFFPQDDASGTSVANLGFWGQVGTINGTVTLNQASPLFNAIKASMLYDGSTGYISVPLAGLKAGGDWSIEAWTRTSSFAQVGGISPRAFIVTLDGSNSVQFSSTPGGAWLFDAWDVSGEHLASFGTNATNTWYHLVGTYVKSSGAVLLYINGAVTPSTGGGTNYGYGSAGINIGRRTDNVGFYPGNTLGCAVYNYVLPAARVAAHYNMGTLGHE